MVKRVFVILDGVGDLPCKVLNGKTPLEAAKTPNLDWYAANGCTGLVHVVGPKIAPESDQGVIGMLGYDPYEYYTGRGPLEAVGAKVRMKDGDLALRANFSSIVGGKLVDRRVGRTLATSEAEELTKAVNKINIGHDFIFKNTLDHRGVLVIKGDFSSEISNVDPAYVRHGKFNVANKSKEMKLHKCKSLDGKEKSEMTASLVNEFVKKIYHTLKNHPINVKRGKKMLLPGNIIIFRDAGVELPTFPKKKNWAAVTGMPLEKGIAKLCGMSALVFEYPKLKIGQKRDETLFNHLKAEIKYAKKYIRYGDYDSYYIHLKPTDIPGHDGDPVLKMKLIEFIDKHFFKFLRRKKVEVLVGADHSTPCELKRHSDDPVPVLWYGGDKDDTTCYSEKECAKGSLGTLLGKDLLKRVGFE